MVWPRIVRAYEGLNKGNLPGSHIGIKVHYLRNRGSGPLSLVNKFTGKALFTVEHGENQSAIARVIGLDYREIKVKYIVYYCSLIYHRAGNS